MSVREHRLLESGTLLVWLSLHQDRLQARVESSYQSFYKAKYANPSCEQCEQCTGVGIWVALAIGGRGTLKDSAKVSTEE